MTAREIELRELEAIYKMKYGFITDGRRKTIAEELLRAYRNITDAELEQVTALADGNAYKALHKLVVMELLGMNL